MKVEAWTDGACNPNPGTGGWGVVLEYEDGEIEQLHGGCRDTTNNRMELTAVLEAIGAVDSGTELLVRTDSELMEGYFTGYYDCHDEHLLRLLLEARKVVVNRGIALEVEWVQSHAGIEFNEMADDLAKLGWMEAGGEDEGVVR